MFSASRNFIALLIAIAPAASLRAQSPTTAPAETKTVLRVAADPNSLPFSNDRCEGFENKIAELVAKDLGLKLEYVWHAQRRGFFRDTLKNGDCDMVIGMPVDLERALPTTPYYRSCYVFVTRTDRKLDLHSLDDAALRNLKIGVQLIGDDYANAPPAHALARRGIVNNVVGFSVYSDYREPNPPARIIEAVARGDIDTAIVWGPLGGFFADRQSVPLTVSLVSEQFDPPVLPLAFDIGMGIRRKDPALRDRVNQVLAHRQSDIDKILDDYHIPRVSRPAQKEPKS